MTQPNLPEVEHFEEPIEPTDSGGLGLCSMCEKNPASTMWGFPVCLPCSAALDRLHVALRDEEETLPDGFSFCNRPGHPAEAHRCEEGA